MIIPKYYTIRVNKRSKLNLSEFTADYYQREGFKEKEIKNMIEREIRDSIWEYINENDIQIIIE